MLSLPARLRAGLPALTAALALGACDIPTAPPKLETTWRIPVDATTFSVTELLPSSVTTTDDGTAFVLDFEPQTIARSLGQLCAPCAAAHGFTVPKPAFTANIDDDVELPSDVASVTVSGGSLAVQVRHTFGFDPLRPSATARGSLTISLTNQGRTLGTVTQSGTNVDLPSGSSRTFFLPVTGQISGPITVALTLTSPAGDPVTINSNSTFETTVSSSELELSQASVAVQNQQVSVDQVELDLSDVDETVADHVLGGELLLTIVNPFTVQGNLSLTVQGAGMNIPAKTVSIAPASTTEASIAFTGPELQSMLGREVTLTLSGQLSGVGATVAVTPNQVVVVRSSLQLDIGPTEE